MRRRRRSRTGSREEADRDFDRALEAMTASELRSFVRTVVDGLDDDRRITITDSLVARATRGSLGWKPSRASTGVVDESARSRTLLDELPPRIRMTSATIFGRALGHF